MDYIYFSSTINFYEVVNVTWINYFVIFFTAVLYLYAHLLRKHQMETRHTSLQETLLLKYSKNGTRKINKIRNIYVSIYNTIIIKKYINQKNVSFRPYYYSLQQSHAHITPLNIFYFARNFLHCSNSHTHIRIYINAWAAGVK